MERYSYKEIEEVIAGTVKDIEDSEITIFNAREIETRVTNGETTPPEPEKAKTKTREVRKSGNGGQKQLEVKRSGK